MSKECQNCTVPIKINKLIYTLLAFIIIFIFSVILNDETGIKAERRIKLPILGVDFESSQAYDIGPLIIIFVTICLHLIVQSWYQCDKSEIEKKLCISKVDFLLGDFNFNFIFYGITPIALFLFHFSSRGKPEHFLTGLYFLVATFLLISLRLLYLQKTRRFFIAIPFYIIIFLLYFMYKDTLDISNVHPLNLRGSNLTGQFLIKLNLKNVKAERANFDGCNLYRQNFYGAIAQYSNFHKTNLFQAEFCEADFGSANFSNSKLGMAKLERSRFTGATFNDAFINNANIKESDFEGAELNNVQFFNTNISDTNLSYTTFTNAKFINSNILMSDFTEANLEDADFSGATLFLCDMNRANLKNSQFDKAIFDGVTLKGVDLTTAKNVTQKQLDGACGDKYTITNGYKLKNCPNFHEFIKILHSNKAYNP